MWQASWWVVGSPQVSSGLLRSAQAGARNAIDSVETCGRRARQCRMVKVVRSGLTAGRTQPTRRCTGPAPTRSRRFQEHTTVQKEFSDPRPAHVARRTSMPPWTRATINHKLQRTHGIHTRQYRLSVVVVQSSMPATIRLSTKRGQRSERDQRHVK